VTDWQEWHGRYDDADSSLSRRLLVVQRRLDELLRGASHVRRVLSLCAGDARDILPVLARQSPGQRPTVTLVEIDPMLSAAARRRAADSGVVVNTIVGDAGLAATWHDVVPVDLLVLCGIFGNIGAEDIRATINAAPALLTRGGTVLWTRGYFTDEDLRPRIRQWFAEAGFVEIAFDSEPVGYGVGVSRLAVEAPVTRVPDRLFSFVR